MKVTPSKRRERRAPATQALWKVSVSIASESEDAVVETLTVRFGQPVSVFADLEKHTTVASIYVAEFTRADRAALREVLAAVRAAGLDLGTGRVSIRKVKRENWAESWKRHFKPLEISDRLLVLPSWSRRRAKSGQTVVILDPGLSFGTGHHPTTGFCLQQVASVRGPGNRQSLLDIGSGSGILSIAALKLGYAPVRAFDFDPEAVRVAKENAQANQLRLFVSRQDLTRLPVRAATRFTVVCANLMYDLLIQERRRILNRLAPGGTLVLAGILREQFPAVRRAYEAAGMQLVAERRLGEWHSAAFQTR